MKLLLVGAGQLGSRHLQSCLKCSQPLDIYVVDNSIESLNLSKKRASEIKVYSHHKIQYLMDYKKIDESFFDFLIIATGASVRYKILCDVLEQFSFNYTILEKVLFQELDSYDAAARLIINYDVKSFVNCPLRAYPFFKQIKEKYISTKKQTILKYSGGEWVGLACNSIHYLDLINYITGEKLEKINIDNLNDGYIESKRIGCVEFTGKLENLYSSGSKVLIEAIKGSSQDSVIDIRNGNFRFIIDELSGSYQIFEGEKLIEKNTYDIVYQSDLTHKMIEQLLLTETCDLISFDKSIEIHKKFITKLLEHYNKFIDIETEILPIT